MNLATDPSALARHYRAVRALTEQLVQPLSDADATIQPMPDASPAKWHLGHTTWFFETFILRDYVASYRLYQPDWPFLFNSYYEAEGQRLLRAARGMLSRPTLADVLAYRHAVDDALLTALEHLSPDVLALVELGCHHEQQHQELLLTDILYTFSRNPLEPALWPQGLQTPSRPADLQWVTHAGGIASIGHDGQGFAFDCETPSHPTMLAPHALANRLVTNGEWIEFIRDGSYGNPRLWLADGWAWAQGQSIKAPLYWREDDGVFSGFTLSGRQEINPDAPVCHISLYEADAFATWAAARLPTEGEWEHTAKTHTPCGGTPLVSGGDILPRISEPGFFGAVWQWTGSAYRPYPGFRIADGAIGEYNGKFMSGQFVLRGSSCATPRGHSRATYRNFFYPHQRWQFTGLRLARDLP